MSDLDTLATLIQLPDAAGAKASVLAIAAAANPPLTADAFVLGDPTERWVEISARAMDAWGTVPTAASRGLFLGLQTDPGDPGDLSADQTPRAGFLTALGNGWHGTDRDGADYATTSVTLTNTSGSPITFKPFDLTFERNYTAADGGSPTYKNTSDPTIYTNVDGSVTIAAGASKSIPVEAQQIGTYGSATPGSITILVTQSFGAMTVTNPTAAVGSDREGRDSYIARCKLAPNRLSPGGPAKGYLYAMNTGGDGKALQRYDGSGPVTITRAQVIRSAANGTVDCYFANASGAADATDVASANANITGVANGIITAPIGIVPDCITYTGHAATNTTIAITYSARILASTIGAAAGTYTSGGSPPAAVAAVFTAISTALGAYLAAVDVGGLDQVSNAGVVYTSDLQDAIKETRSGLYAVTVSLPASSTTAIPLGHVPALGTVSGTLVLV